MRTYLISALVAFALDQITKYYVIFHLQLWRVRAIDVYDPYLNFRYGENYGINFGIGGDGVNAWIWIALALGVCAWVCWWVWSEPMSGFARICAGWVLGGALGNVFDRAAYGYVLDFLNMSCCGINNRYSFNVADIFIFAGAIALVFLTPSKKKAA